MGLIQIGFLGALAAVAIPIVIHLTFGRRARRVDLGTLRFLKIVLEQNVRRRRLKRWILLALRMACLSLLALLFARPYLLAHRPPSDDRLIVILLDRSASMGLVSDRSRLVDLALTEAQRIVARRGDRTQFEIAWFDHAVYPLTPANDKTPSPSHSQKSTKELLSQSPPSDTLSAGTDYGAALAWARDVFVQSQHAYKELYLLTDMQRSGLDRSDPGPLPADVRTHLVDLGQPFPRNVALVRVTAGKLTPRPGEPVALEATLFNAGLLVEKEIPVILHLRSGNHQQDLRAEIDLDAGATGTVRFESAGLAEGFWQGYVMAEVDDDLAFDNRRHVALLAARPLQVTVVDGDPSGSPYAAETYYLAAALRLAPPGASFAESPFEPKTVSIPGSARLPELEAADLVVLANVASFSTAEARRLAEFVRSGGGLLVFCGENVQADGYRSFATAGISVGRILGARPATTLRWRLDGWDRKHPVFLPFNDPQYGDLRLAFDCRTGVEPANGTEVLAWFRGSEPAVLERRHGRGKILWFLSACDRDWSNWPRSRLFLPLVHQMLGYLAGLTEGGPVREVVLDETRTGDGGLLGVFDRGSYHEVVNCDPRESETDRCNPGELAARLELAVATDEDESSAEIDLAAAGVADLRPDEIWHWVLLALIAILLVENFLANRTPT